MAGKAFKIITIFMVSALCMTMSYGCNDRVGLAPEQSLTYNLGIEPEAIDPALSTSSEGANVIVACFEGLMKLDKNGKAIPGIAASYIRESDTAYTFKLKDTKWSDGKPVTAKDFEYAWKRVLNPETGARYAYQMYCLKNGQNYNKKRASSDSVGVKALDETTLEVTLEGENPYFLELLTSPIFMPVRDDVIRSNPEKWTNIPSTYTGNGPFKMTSWLPRDAIEFVKNEEYYDAGRVRLSKIVFTMIEEPETSLASWENGGIDVAESLPFSEIPRLKSENKLIITPELATYFYVLNNEKKPLNDKRVRKALSYAIDRNSIIQDITKSHAIPATAFVSKGVPDSDTTKDFRDVGGAYFKSQGQIAEAQRLLQEAGYPNGIGFPTLTVIYNNSSSHVSIARAIQEMWMRNLGISVNLKGYEWSNFHNLRKSGNYEIARQGWSGDYVDPMTFLDLFRSGGGNNDSRHSNKAYDELLDRAKKEQDRQKRMVLLHEAESVLMDDMPVIPIFFYTNPILIKPYVKGVTKSPLGFIYFDGAYVDDEK